MITRSHAIVLALLPFLTLGTTVAAVLSVRLRDLFFMLMVAGAVLTEKMDVHFLSEAWYRGSTRGLEISLLEVLAFALLVGCLLGRRREGEPRWFWPPGLGPVLCFALYAGLLVIASHPRIFGLFELTKMAGGILLILATSAYVRSRREWTLLLLALSAAVGIEGLWAVKQRLFTGIERVSGSLDHANSLSMYLCLCGPLLVAAWHQGWSIGLRRICGTAAGLATVGILLTVSRAGIPVFLLAGLGATLACMSARLTPKRLIVGTIILAATGAVGVAVWPEVEARYATATFQEEYFDPQVDGRGVYLRLAKAIASEHFFGVGLNNWSYYVSSKYGPAMGYRFMDYDFLISVYGPSDKIFADSYLAAPAHNLGALTLGELGIPGLCLFSLVWLRWFGLSAAFFKGPRSDPLRTMGVGLFFSFCGIFGQSVTEWVYRQSPIYFTVHILAGALASLVYVRRREVQVARAAAWSVNDEARTWSPADGAETAAAPAFEVIPS